MDENPYKSPDSRQQPKQRSFALRRTFNVAVILVFTYVAAVAVHLIVIKRGDPVRHIITIAILSIVIVIQAVIFIRTFHQRN